MNSLVTLSSNTDEAVQELPQETFSFNPAHDPQHALLMRRALEASLILRNLTLTAANSSYIVNVRGFPILLKEVLELPDVILVIKPENNKTLQRKVGGLRDDHEEWLELEGINELRLHFLDMLEVLAPKVGLNRRAPFEVTASGEPVEMANTESYSESVPGGRVTRPGNGIFLRLLHFVNHSNDRALLIGSLRCLSVMAATEMNETAFAEIETAEGNLSPGLLRRCVELLATPYDHEILEWTLELLYQLVSIGSNAFRLCSRPITSTFSSAGSTDSNATSGALAVVKMLVRVLSVNKSVWERDHALVPSVQRWVHTVPSKLRADAFDKLRNADTKHRRQMARMNMSIEQRVADMRLTVRERRRLLGLQEPERAAEW